MPARCYNLRVAMTIASLLTDLTSIGRQPSLREIEDKLVMGDCLDVLPSIPDNSVDLIHTSPPYNIDRPYKGQRRDLHSQEAYLDFLARAIDECKRVLKPNGSIFWQTGYTQLSDGVPGDILPLDVVTYGLFHEGTNPLVLWDRVIWRYFGGMAFKRKFTNRHETILWYVKPDNGTAEPRFEVDLIRERSRELDKRNNFWGRNPGNVWEVDRVAFGSTSQSSHIAVFPDEITERIVRACSRKGDLVLDPFAGSGTTPKVARGLGRRWIGIEVVEDYAREASVRIGYQQPNEVRALASAIIKNEIFGARKGSLEISAVARQLSWWLTGVNIQRLRDAFEKLVAEALNDDSRSGVAKRKAWQTLDQWIEEEPARDPVVTADRLLRQDYRLRRNWNGASRYRTALDLLDQLVAVATNAEGMLDAFVTDLVDNEPSSYQRREKVVDLIEASRRLKVKSPEIETVLVDTDDLDEGDEGDYQARMPI